MTPAVYIRPDARSSVNSGTSGATFENTFSPTLTHWPWIEDATRFNGACYYLGAASFPLQDNALPPEMYEMINVKEWRITGTFNDPGDFEAEDRPDMSRTMTYVFPAGVAREWVDADTSYDVSWGDAWIDPDMAIRGNGYVSDYPYTNRMMTASIFRQERESHVNEDDETEYYYISIGCCVGKPILYRPTTGAYLPAGATLNEWCWVLPINGARVVGAETFSFGDSFVGGSGGSRIYFNGVALDAATYDGSDWSITLSVESYF